MIKNLACAVGALLLPACGVSGAQEAEAFQGIVEHEERVLAFEVGGRLATVEVDEGVRVEAGALLATLDDRLAAIERAARAADLEAARARLSLVEAGSRAEEIRATRAELEAARERVRVAEAELARQRTLEATGATAAAATDRLTGELAQARGTVQSLTQRLRLQRSGARVQEIDEAEAAVEAASQGLAAADRRVELHRLTSPIAGTILEVLHEPGEIVAAGTPVVTLADLAKPYADVFVPQAEAGRVRVGAEVRVRVDAYDEPFVGRVERVSDRTEFTPRFLFSDRERPNLVVRVRVAIDDPEHRLHAGLPAFVTLGAP